jgi:hypothetical protein
LIYPIDAFSKKTEQAKKGFEPIVTVSTQKINNRIEISCCDYGIIVLIRITDKIFQLLFTTKLKGEGPWLIFFAEL